MRHFLIILFLSLPSSIFAQYIPSSFQAPQGISICQIDNHENSTLVFVDYTAPKDSTLQQGIPGINISDKTFITIPGSPKKFNLLSSVNIPIDSEAERKLMVFDNPGQRHKFVLEFEKLPEGCSNFNIVENVQSPFAYNIRNIHFNPQDSVELINIENFIADYPVKEYGYYYSDGNLVSYIKHKGIVVNSFASFLDQYGKYICVNVCVQNLRNRPILFNPETLSASAYRHPIKKELKYIYDDDVNDDIYVIKSEREGKGDNRDIYDITKKEPVEVKLLSYNDYDRIVKGKQNWETFCMGLGDALATAGASVSYSTTYTTVYNQAGGIIYPTTYAQTHANFNGPAMFAASQLASANLANLSNYHSEIRRKINEGYVKMNTIPSETQYSGFFNVKYKKRINCLTYTIIIDGEPFTFYFNGTIVSSHKTK